MLVAAVGVLGAPAWAQGEGKRVGPDPRATLFVRRGCTECHAISGLGVKAKSDVGPDLTFAYADVFVRYGVTLESFLANPAGIMRLVLAAHLRLTAAEQDSILHVLKGLYDERQADMDAEIPSLPPLEVVPSGRTDANGGQTDRRVSRGAPPPLRPSVAVPSGVRSGAPDR
jgi:hypothetical protein